MKAEFFPENLAGRLAGSKSYSYHQVTTAVTDQVTHYLLLVDDPRI